MVEGHRDLVIASVYMPFLSDNADQRVEYGSMIGCLQSIVDRNIGCDFVFGDFNVSKSRSNANSAMIHDFCSLNDILWLDPVNNDITYTFHAENNVHYSHIDHMLVSPALVHDHQSVIIHVEDHNASDHYAISTVVNIYCNNTTKKKYVKNKTLKYLWNKGDVNEYANMLSKELSNIVFHKTVMTCDGLCQHNCSQMIDQ